MANQTSPASWLQDAITQVFGCTGFSSEPKVGGCQHYHLGVDLQAPFGQQLTSPVQGTVVQAATDPAKNGGYGNYVVVQAQNGYQWLFGHLSQILVKPGQSVGMGDVLGATGSSGNSTGPHLHVGVFQQGSNPLGSSGAVDPGPLLTLAKGIGNLTTNQQGQLQLTLPLVGQVSVPTQVQGNIVSDAALNLVQQIPGVSSVGDFFNKLGINLWRLFFYVVGGLMVILGLIIYVFSDQGKREEILGDVAAAA